MVKCPLAGVSACFGCLGDGLQTHSNMPCASQHEWADQAQWVLQVGESLEDLPDFWSGPGVLLQVLREQGLWEESMSYLLLFGSSVVSDSLRPHGLQHTRLPCPSPSPGACANSYPLSW